MVRRLKSRYQGRCGSIFRTTVYTLILGAIVAFLVRLGPQPWYLAALYWPTVAGVAFTIGVSIAIQAQSFRSVLPKNSPYINYSKTLRIWSFAALVSIIAPFLIGVATRSTLLIRSGLNLRICVFTTLRQTWMGLELAFLFGTISFPFTRLPWASSTALVFGIFWSAMVMFRQFVTADRLKYLHVPNWLIKAINPITEPFGSRIHPWFELQVLLMSTAYYIAFNSVGAGLNIAETTALASGTVILNFLFFIPNGLGINDSVWVLVGTSSALSLNESVAVALIIRLAHFIAAFLVMVITETHQKMCVRT